jgi:hypothetical protein
VLSEHLERYNQPDRASDMLARWEIEVLLGIGRRSFNTYTAKERGYHMIEGNEVDRHLVYLLDGEKIFIPKATWAWGPIE